MKFVALTKGNCWLHVDGDEKPLAVVEGDVLTISLRRSTWRTIIEAQRNTTPATRSRTRRMGCSNRQGQGVRTSELPNVRRPQMQRPHLPIAASVDFTSGRPPDTPRIFADCQNRSWGVHG